MLETGSVTKDELTSEFQLESTLQVKLNGCIPAPVTKNDEERTYVYELGWYRGLVMKPFHPLNLAKASLLGWGAFLYEKNRLTGEMM